MKIKQGEKTLRLHEWDFQKIKDTIFKTAVGSNLFSNTFLDLARRGHHGVGFFTVQFPANQICA